MYDSEEQINNLKSAADSSIRTGKELYSLYEKFLKAYPAEQAAVPTVTPIPAAEPFMFTGQVTDLSYFAIRPDMPISMIESIPDEKLRAAVKDEFNRAAREGKVRIDGGRITLTPEGNKYINKPEFREAARSNTQRCAIEAAQEQCFVFTGTQQDLAYFRFAEKLDLTEIIAHPDKAAARDILARLAKFESQGLLKLSGMTATLTPQGMALVAGDAFKAAATKPIAAVAGIPGVVAVAIKSAATAILANSAKTM